jgi:ABC-type multidrug transport system fused ATPase/permease subunit
MASATPWGALPQAEALAEKVEDKIERFVDDEKRGGDHQRQTIDSHSSETQSIEPEEKDHVHELARAFTQASIRGPTGEYVNPFEGSDNPLLDPASGKFSARAWTKNLVAIQSRDPERYPGRTAGVAYKNLSAHGFGNPTDYQKTFGNYPLEAASLFKRLIGQRQQTKIQILRDFDGLVKSGEMLVVLGRPGSGCSTLLKTIAGETDGFYVDTNSYINYQGIPMEQMHKVPHLLRSTITAHTDPSKGLSR